MHMPLVTAADIDKLTALRHWLHAHPEVSRQEFSTAEYIRTWLQNNAQPDDTIPLAGAGFAAVYNGTSKGKTILIRAELDALPIHEINDDITYRSVYDGVGHKCGHDGHMSMLSGLALAFSKKRPDAGRIVLLYQPDEETGTGARECANHPNFKQIEPDYAFSLHNFPNFPKGEILCREGTFTSAVKFYALKLTGKESHSAMPETGKNPAMAIAEITQAAQTIQNQYDTPENYALIVPIYFQMGVSSSGVSPAYGEAHFTLRTPSNETVAAMWEEFSAMAQTIADTHGLKLEFDCLEDFAANANDAEFVSMVQKAAQDNNLSYTNLQHCFRGGEDFGEITKRYKGGMFGLGSGENKPELHNPDYDFPDDIMPAGIQMFLSLIDQAMSSKENKEKQAA